MMMCGQCASLPLLQRCVTGAGVAVAAIIFRAVVTARRQLQRVLQMTDSAELESLAR